MIEYDIIINPSPPGSLHVVHCPLTEKNSSIGFDRVNHCAMTHGNKLLTLAIDCSHAVASGKHEQTLCEIQEQPETSVSSYVAICRNNEIHLSEISQSHQMYPVAGMQSKKNSEASCEDTGTAKAMVPRPGSAQENESWRPVNFSTSRSNNAFIHDLFFAPSSKQFIKHQAPDVVKSVLPPIQWSKYSLRKAITQVSMVDQVYRIMHDIQVLTIESVISLLNWLESHDQRCAIGPLSSHQQNILIEALRQCSVYIHGFWVCKAAHQPLSQWLQYVREFILLCFFRSGVDGLSRAALAEELPLIKQSDILTILNDLSTLDPVTKKWRLKDLSRSISSTKPQSIRLPKVVVDDERIAWIQREPLVIRNVKSVSTVNAKNESPLTMPWKPPMRAGLDSEETSKNALEREHKSSLTIKQREDVKMYIRDLYGVHGVIHGSRLMPLIREEKRKPASRLRSLTEAQIFEALKPLLIMLNKDKATAIRSWDYAELDRYRDVIIEMLQKGNASREMLTREINERTLVPISDKTFRSIMYELARFNVNEAMWSFKSGLDM